MMDGRAHWSVMTSFVERGYPPTVDELASDLACSSAEVIAALQRLHDGHGLVLHPNTHDIWIAHPFAASPTAVWVELDAPSTDDNSRGWWAPCLWCASGIVALAAKTATIHVRLGGEHEAMRLEVTDGSAIDNPLVHFAIPPRAAWSNVVHWCATVLPFRDASEVEAWCARHRIPRGELVPWSQVLELGRRWYGRHLDEDWRKHSIAEAQTIFDEAGLVGDFWKLPVSDQPF